MRKVIPQLSLFLGAWLAVAASGDPLNGGLQLGTSVSQSYDARSVFTNPAALGFQTELNGADLASSFTYGFNEGPHNDYALGLSYGYFGFGWERYAAGLSDTLSRYDFAVGIPLSPEWFVGGRYVLNRYDSPLGFDTVDLGLQYRPSRMLSFGITANGINQPVVGAAHLPWQLVLGATARPTDWLELSLDGDSLSGGGETLFKSWGYQASAAIEAVPGVKLRVSYHDLYQFMFGLEIRLGHASVYGSLEPGSSARHVVTGFDLTATPYRSALIEPSVLRLGINGELEEKPAPSSLFATDHPTLLGLLERLREAQERPQITRVVIRLTNFPLGLAAAEEVYRALRELKAHGKFVEVYLGNASMKEYLIASVADRIHMEPQGELKLVGLHSERYYLKGTLDKIGIEGEFLARGEYKSAPETFTRRDSSPASREETLTDLREAQGHLEKLLIQSGRVNAEKLAHAYNTALFGADEAKQAGLIDSVDSYLASKDSDKNEVATLSTEERSESLRLPPRVAVIVAAGDIMESKVRALSLGGENQVTPAQIKDQLEAAVADSRTAAIVLRIDSPGGEILPSHEISVMVEKAREKKPVVVSMGDVAASGGYYIAAPAERIFAGPLTFTGSIGVFLGKVNAAGLYKWLQLNKEIISEFPHAALFAEDRPWSPDDRAVFVRRLNGYYTGFVHYVARHRKLTDQEAEEAAQGRVWLGDHASALALVDQLGGYREAIAYAAKKAGAGDNYEVWLLQESVGLFDLFGEDGLLARSVAPSRALTGLLSEQAARTLRWIEALRADPFLYLAPDVLSAD